ncbi:MAG: 50S ribosomal protein L25/general stress protein Ctc [Deltaproteobacteria bacterium]|nr:50S ribosomal protein L25/general stress protein Ctc [Deltaproteobacteria bacterium]
MEQHELKAKVRKTIGNGPARALRREGKVPAVLYGPKTEPILLSVEVRDIEQLLKTGNVGQILLNLIIQNGQETTRPAMIKELQAHPVSGQFLHVDFYEIDLTRKIRVGVPVVATGKSVGVEVGGLLQIVRHELEVLCLPTQIPESIEVDVTNLEIGDSIHVEEIELEGDVEIPADVNFTIITCLAPKVEAEPEVEEEELEEEAEEAEGEEAEADKEAPEATEAE